MPLSKVMVRRNDLGRERNSSMSLVATGSAALLG